MLSVSNMDIFLEKIRNNVSFLSFDSLLVVGGRKSGFLWKGEIYDEETKEDETLVSCRNDSRCVSILR